MYLLPWGFNSLRSACMDQQAVLRVCCLLYDNNSKFLKKEGECFKLNAWAHSLILMLYSWTTLATWTESSSSSVWHLVFYIMWVSRGFSNFIAWWQPEITEVWVYRKWMSEMATDRRWKLWLFFFFHSSHRYLTTKRLLYRVPTTCQKWHKNRKGINWNDTLWK